MTLPHCGRIKLPSGSSDPVNSVRPPKMIASAGNVVKLSFLKRKKLRTVGTSNLEGAMISGWHPENKMEHCIHRDGRGEGPISFVDECLQVFLFDYEELFILRLAIAHDVKFGGWRGKRRIVEDLSLKGEVVKWREARQNRCKMN